MLQLAPGMTVNGLGKQKSFEIRPYPIPIYSVNAAIVHFDSDVTGLKIEQ